MLANREEVTFSERASRDLIRGLRFDECWRTGYGRDACAAAGRSRLRRGARRRSRTPPSRSSGNAPATCRTPTCRPRSSARRWWTRTRTAPTRTRGGGPPTRAPPRSCPRRRGRPAGRWDDGRPTAPRPAWRAGSDTSKACGSELDSQVGRDVLQHRLRLLSNVGLLLLLLRRADLHSHLRFDRFDAAGALQLDQLAQRPAHALAEQRRPDVLRQLLLEPDGGGRHRLDAQGRTGAFQSSVDTQKRPFVDG